jgi:hypothetical protein
MYAVASTSSSASDAGTGELVDEPVHLGLGRDVDAARRLVKDEDIGTGENPFADYELLLVAAGGSARGIAEPAAEF